MDREQLKANTNTTLRPTLATTQHGSNQRPAVRWQFVVSSGLGRCPTVGTANQLCRIDLAHPLFPPYLTLGWNREVGVHQKLDDQGSLEKLGLHQPVDLPGIAKAESQSFAFPDRIGPARPKMLNPSVKPTAGQAADARTGQAVAAMDSAVWDDAMDRVGPLANDLQAPLTAAYRTLHSILDRIRSGNPMSLEDTRLLKSTADNLAVLSGWTDDILLSHKTQLGIYSLIRKRFKTQDWRNVLHNLLEHVAHDRSIDLQWIGWEESLPNLYLDPNVVTKALCNLVHYALQASPSGSTLRIKASQQSSMSRHLMIAVQADNCNLSQEIIQLINGSACPIAPNLPANALVSAKKLIVAHGGSLSAHRNLRGGCDLRISLPVDTAESLVCSWLVRNFQHGSLSSKNYINLYAAKLHHGNAELANTRLQQAATSQSLVIRVSGSRWLILELNPVAQPTASMTIRSALAAQADADVAEDHLNEPSSKHPQDSVTGGSTLNWLEQIVFRTQTFLGNSSRSAAVANPQFANPQFPHLLEEIAGKVQFLMAQQPLILDGLDCSPSEYGTASSLGASKGLVKHGRTYPGLQYMRTETSHQRPSTVVSEAPGADVVSDIIKQWKIVQAKLALLGGSLESNHAGVVS